VNFSETPQAGLLEKRLEMAVWVILAGLILLPRMYLWHLLPVPLWSKDAYSYAWPVFEWLDTGDWHTDPRRGTVYALLIAACAKLGIGFSGLILVQHVLGGFAVLGGMVMLRMMIGARWALVPLVACGGAYAVYAGPISMEHLVRNETLLFLFATGALGALAAGFTRGHVGWFFAAGIFASLLALTKGVFAPLIPMTLLALAVLYRGDWKKVGLLGAALLAGYALPSLANKAVLRLSESNRPPEPQSGLLLFARVAQFTVLDGGIEPEIKALIRQDIVDYIALVKDEGDLDNNIPLNRTAVPRMREHLLKQGKTAVDLNTLCRSLAVEAIKTHPREYFSQVWGDWVRLHLSFASRVRGPDASDVRGSIKNYKNTPMHALLELEKNVPLLETRTDKKFFRGYQNVVDGAWLFQCSPVLLTSLLLPFFLFMGTPAWRAWWWVAAALWYFNIVLLCTVGKPMNRYLLPVTPIIFMVLAGKVTSLWLFLLRSAGRIRNRVSTAQS